MDFENNGAHEPRSKLINRIPGSCLLILDLPGSALRRHVESLGRAFKIQHEFSKPCLVNLISEDTHLVFSIFSVEHDCDNSLCDEYYNNPS